MISPALVLTPKQAAERLGIRLPTLRKHAATWEALSGESLPRGEHLERLWPEPVVTLLGEALSMVHRREATSVEGALQALYHPATPPPATLPGLSEDLRALIREELRVVVREELNAVVRELAVQHVPTVQAPAGEVHEAVRLEVREALNPDRLRVLLHAATPPEPRRRGWLARLLRL